MRNYASRKTVMQMMGMYMCGMCRFLRANVSKKFDFVA